MNTPDAILMLIERHRAAAAAWRNAEAAISGIEDRLGAEVMYIEEPPEFLAAEKAERSAWRAAERAAVGLLGTPPRTMAGCVALLNYAAKIVESPDPLVDDATVKRLGAPWVSILCGNVAAALMSHEGGRVMSNVTPFAGTPEFKAVSLGLSPAQRNERGRRSLEAIAGALPFAFAFIGMDGEDIVVRVAAMRLAVDNGPSELLAMLTAAEREADMLREFLGAAKERLAAAIKGADAELSTRRPPPIRRCCAFSSPQLGTSVLIETARPVRRVRSGLPTEPDQVQQFQFSAAERAPFGFHPGPVR